MRRRLGPRVLPAAVALALFLPAAAFGFWAATGSGTATPAVASLAAPVASASSGAGEITLSWAKVAAPGSGEVKYYVSRTGGTAPKTNCPTSVATAETEKEFVAKQGGLTCKDEGFAAGETRHYTVTVVWRTWSATSSEVSGTATAAVSKFVVSFEHAEAEAGVADNMTVSAEDSSNRVVESYTGAHSLTLEVTPAESVTGERSYVTNETGGSVHSKGEGKFTFAEGRTHVVGADNGKALFFDAAATTVTVKNAEGEGSTALTVKAGAFKSFHVETLTAEPTAGKADEIKLTAWDEWHNVITTYARTAKLVYSGAEKSPDGTAAVYGTGEPTFAAGIATVTGFTFYDAASTTLKVDEETSGHAGEATFTVKPVAGASLTAATGHFAWTKTRVTAGTLSAICLFTCEDSTIGNSGKFYARVAVTDEWGNTVTNVGAGHEVRVEEVGGESLNFTIPAAGTAESNEFYYTSEETGEGTTTLVAKRLAGTEYHRAEGVFKY
ncbi:MAG TPA: hypothetical protein VMA83_08150 [Solirubrobacteraceae bacterium]|nr:hypothetical protein [Solirubrobacteraceae bacterium]